VSNTTPPFQLLFRADCLDILRGMADGTVHAVVCDPPYHLTSIVERFGKEGSAAAKVPEGGSGVYARSSKGFMGQTWDGGDIAFRVELWREVFRVLTPGGYLLAFGGTRTYHRMACAIEDAGFSVRDQIGWHYGSGFPKSLNVSIAIDKAAGAMGHRGKRVSVAGNRTAGGEDVPHAAPVDAHEPITDDARRWSGWGTALKPAFEPIVVARKPLEGTVAANVLKYGTGAMNIDGCRVPHGGDVDLDAVQRQQHSEGAIDGAFGAASLIGKEIATYKPEGRWPANLIMSHDVNCDEDGCVAGCPCAIMDAQSGVTKSTGGKFSGPNALGQDSGWNAHNNRPVEINRPTDAGGASRFFNNLPIEEDDYPPFFYTAKASRKEREAGCENLPARSGAEAVHREEGSDGLKSPRAGAGRTAESVRNGHPTVKPLSVMSWLVTLVTPPNGVVMDPFMGSGTTGIAAVKNGFSFIGCEQSEEYLAIAEARIRHHGGDPEVIK